MTSILLDCDPGHDDALALLLALGSEEVRLLGVTTVAGNQTLERTTANAIRVLDHVGRADVPVAAGASRPLLREPHVAVDMHGESGLDGAKLPAPGREAERAHAIDFIAATLESAAAPVTLVATGPLTNVALFLARYPDLGGRLERVVLMGGAIGLGNTTPAAEFNMWADPEAAQRVLSSGLDLTMVGLDVTHKALIRREQLERLRAAGAAGALVADMYGFSLPVHERRYGWDGAPIHDAVALAHVIDPSLLETAHRGVLVDTGPEPSRGRTYVDLWGRAGWERNCHVATGVDAERFLALIVERVSRLG